MTRERVSTSALSTEAMLIVLDWSGGNQREIDRLQKQKKAAAA